MSEVCFFCKKNFKDDEYVYAIKLDDGTVVLSHGYPCCDKANIRRLPVNPPDWWIKIHRYPKQEGCAECYQETEKLKQKLQQLIEQFRQELYRQEAMRTFSQDNVNLAFNRFAEKFEELLNEAQPKEKKQVKS